MNFEIGNPKDYHVGFYIRISKEDENEGPSESVTNQRSLLRRFADEHSLHVYDTYIDDGWSGTSFDRPDFKRLLEDIEKKKINMVVTKDLSRLGRDYILTGHYMERYFPEKGVRYISLLDGIDTGVESTANDITPFRAIMNDMYAKDISKKIRSVKRDKQRKGLFIGGKAIFGYMISLSEKNRIVIDEKAAAIVRRVFGMALDGISCRQIACRLNEEKIPTPAAYAELYTGHAGPYSGMWSAERISDMLRNETYIGNMVQGKSVKLNYKSRKSIRQARENWVVVENTHEPIIDKADFQKVQSMINSRKQTRLRTYDFLLKGLIFCHECGYPLAVINRKNARGEDCLYFVCRTYQRFSRSGACTCHSIKEKTVTEAVTAKVHEAIQEYLPEEELIAAAENSLQKAREEQFFVKEINTLKKRIENINSRLDRTYSDKLNGTLDDKDFERVYAHGKNERAILEQSLSELEASADVAAGRECSSKELVGQFTDSSLMSRELLISLVERVELTQDRQVLIHFRFHRPEKAV
ncbi:MAG: recombinase family protein [Oscillospiraceae bacterium]|nr:recombinase family protein [Oscillospiraceae bacterium]